MCEFCESSDSLEMFYMREQMRRTDMIMAGHEIAIIEGLRYCEKYDVRPFSALLRAASNALLNHMAGAPKRRGRSSSPLERYQQDMIDFARYEEVICIVEAREHLAAEIELLKTHSGTKARDRQREIEQTLTELGTGLEDAFSLASDRLKKKAERGTQETVRRSYYKVLNNSEHPTERQRYVVLNQKILSQLKR